MCRLVLASFILVAVARSSPAQPYEPYEPYDRDDRYGPVEVAPDVYADTDPSALIDFQAVLDPYGSWVDDPTYGTVWVPSPDEVGYDFVPYQTAGHWAYDGTDYVWVSDYPWGWVPFHYGRWVFSDDFGWVWVPGRAYAPAWVDWRVGYDDWSYVGWAPTPPDYGWFGGAAIGLSFYPSVYYSYVPSRYVFDRHVHRRVESRTGERCTQQRRPAVAIQRGEHTELERIEQEPAEAESRRAQRVGRESGCLL